MVQAVRGTPIDAETQRFLVRSMTERDATGLFRAWIGNPELMAALNMPARRLSPKDVVRFMAGFDDRTRYLIGVFEKKSRDLIGLFLLDVNMTHALAKAAGFIGDRNWRGKCVFEEVGSALFDEFFLRRGLEKATAQVWEKNFAALVPLRRLGFRIEGYLRDEIRSFDRSGRRSQFLLGLLPSDRKTFTYDR
ncbi:MAG: GNAT family N-acetyltransferase [Parvibaculaceae bacterium]